MGVDLSLLAADWAWLGRFPPGERVARLRAAWYADETGLWGLETPDPPEGAWTWPRGPHEGRFAVYEFRGTLGSYKPHFWACERWESCRAHAEPALRAEVDALLGRVVWQGTTGEREHVDAGFLAPGAGEAPSRVLLALTPDTVHDLAERWQRLRPCLGGLRETYTAHVEAVPDGAWIVDFAEFATLVEDWGRVLEEAAGWGWCVVGLGE
ncbi:hypothetical protein FM076_20190 [Streptomyces albus subsp. chlorinus]|uniref:hypothetical protein n=1 Tax=Streptomyces albus TaxID=1888 RepID=UPI0015705FCC|nr:hypothetical protein [Streptomyces albus]NSC23342.1 hypothetical protein [Streptomyces albus subsp. chlorinus]